MAVDQRCFRCIPFRFPDYFDCIALIGRDRTCRDKIIEIHWRTAIKHSQMSKRQCRAKGVKILLCRHLLLAFKIGFPLSLTQRQIMPDHRGFSEALIGERRNLVDNIIFGSITYWAFEPFRQNRVRFYQKTQGFSYVPTVKVDKALNGCFDDITIRKQLRIIFKRSPVDKSDVVIAIGTGKPPRPRTALHGKDNFDAMLPLDFRKPLLDIRADFRIDVFSRAYFRPNSFSISPCPSFTQVGRP